MTSTFWIVCGTALFIALGVATACLVRSLVRANQNSLLGSLPLQREQSITMPPGLIVVMIEAPRFSDDLRQFKIEVRDHRSERTTALSLGYLQPRAKVSGVSTVKIPYGRLEGTSAGDLTVQVNGLQADKDYTAYRLVFSRPFGIRLALQIVGIVFCGVGMLLSVLGVCWAAGLLRAS